MKLIKFLFLIAIFAVGAIAVSRFMHPDETAMAANAPPAMPPVPVPVVVMKEAPVQIWKEFPGRLNAVDSVDIRPQVSGTLTKILFEDGQTVKAGEDLITIDPRPYEAAVAQSKADLESAKNQYDLAQKELARAQELIGTGAIPKRTYDERVSGEAVAKSSIAAATARLKSAQLNLDYAHIKAPITGRISRAEITEGNLVEAGANAPVLTTIVSSTGIYADFDVDEKTYLSHVRSTAKDHEGERKIQVKLILQSAPDAAYDGNIQSFDNKIDTASGTIRARAFFPNEDGTLLPGMFVNVRIGSAESTNGLTVPERAIGTDQDRKFVFVAADGKVAYREVTPGDAVGENRIITNGLKEGDMVITDGIMKLRPDMPVEPQIQKEAEAAPMTDTPPATPTDAVKAEPVKEDETPEDMNADVPAEEIPEKNKELQQETAKP